MSEAPTKTIYDIALHETLEVAPGLRATRVAGGWWYREGEAGTFVPYSTEFKFTKREEERLDALAEFDEIECGR